MDGIWIKKNGGTERIMMPLAEFDFTAAMAAPTVYDSQTAITYIPPEIDPQPPVIARTAFMIHSTDASVIPSLFTGLITEHDPAAEPWYYNAEAYRDCFSDPVMLTQQPDDWSAATGNNHKYYQQVDVGGGSWMVTQPVTFAAGTYYINETLSGIIESDVGMAFGSSMGYCARDGGYIFDAIFGHKWITDSAGNLAETSQWYWPQLFGYPSTRFYQSGWAIEFYQTQPAPKVAAPQSPLDCFTMLCHGEYYGIEYVGILYYKIDGNGQPISFKCMMFPMWLWGEKEPYVPPEPPEPVIPDPQDYGDESWAGGGGGTLSDSNDTPSIGSTYDFYGGMAAYNINIYRVTADKYAAVTQLLWGTGTDHDALWNRWQNYRFSPLQAIILNHFIPLALVPTCTNSAAIKMGGVQLLTTADVPDHQYTDYDVGSISVPEFFGSALDYSPYTVMRLYLPFCGWIEIDPDRVTGGSLSVTYRCDICSGDVCAYVKCTDRTGQITYMYTATGNCSVTMPVTGNDQGTGQMISSLSSAAMGAITGNVLGFASGLLGALTTQQHTQITGSVSGSTAAVADKQCRLQIIRPAPSNPAYAQALRGRPSDVGILIGSLAGTGLSSFSAVHPDIDGATQAECEEIVRLLRDGIIL